MTIQILHEKKNSFIHARQHKAEKKNVKPESEIICLANNYKENYCDRNI